MKRLLAAGMVGVICISILGACTPQKMPDRTVINKGDKQIVVIEDKPNYGDNEIALEKITSFEDMRVLDWISEDSILIMKGNENLPKMTVEDGMAYPKNFYEYHIKTGEEKLIADSKVNMSNGVLSPDKKYIFYKEGVEENLTGFILERETGKKVQITELDSISSYVGRWVDNQTVIFSSLPDGRVLIADITGKVTEIPNTGGKMLSNTVQIGSKIYYVTVDEKMYVQDLDGSNKELMAENVVWLIPSPDMTQFAMVKRTAQTTRTLYITDLEGKELKTLSQATQIYGINWSPDQSKLAYVLMELDNTSGGLFVADTENGNVIKLSMDIQDAADPVRWSPSGKKISVTNLDINENGYKFITNLLELK